MKLQILYLEKLARHKKMQLQATVSVLFYVWFVILACGRDIWMFSHFCKFLKMTKTQNSRGRRRECRQNKTKGPDTRCNIACNIACNGVDTRCNCCVKCCRSRTCFYSCNIARNIARNVASCVRSLITEEKKRT